MSRNSISLNQKELLKIIRPRNEKKDAALHDVPDNKRDSHKPGDFHENVSH
jgi:hypothetical protein